MSVEADRIGSATPDLMVNITDEVYDISPRPVGYGGYSDVHTGVWRSTFGSMKVAIKVIRAAPRSRSASNELPRVLRREISVWKRVLHPNIHFLCGFYEGFGSVPALVSPWYENGDINDYVRLRATDPGIGATKLRLFVDVVTGLQFLHEHHIVHGDIKGGNVLISSTGVARLCDFGLSRLLLGHSQSTTSTGGKGTVRWMAPELLLVDGARHSYASDIWACGCLFIEVYSDVLPYHDKANNHQVLIALSLHELPLRPDDMPDLVWSLVHACCVAEAAARALPSSLLDMIHVCLATERVQKMVQLAVLNRSPNVAETDFLTEIAASLRAMDGHVVSDLHKLANTELATAIIRHYSVWGISCSRLFKTAVFEWCLAEVGIGDLVLPANIPTRDDDVGAVIAAKLRPLARLVAQVHPGLARCFMTDLAKYNMSVESVAWLPDGNRVVYGGDDYGIRILGPAVGLTRRRLVGHTGKIVQVVVSPRGRLLASCSGDMSIRLWDTETGIAIGTPMVVQDDYVYCLAFSPDGRQIVSGSGRESDATIRIWSTETFTTVLGPLHTHSDTVTSVAYSPDGSRIVSGSSAMSVRVWDSRSGDTIISLHWDTQQGPRSATAFSPDVLRMASGSGDGTIRIWDVATGKLVGRPLEAHSSYVRSVAFSPDGTRIAAACGNWGAYTIRVWDAATGTSIATIVGHTSIVYSVAFSPDGTRLASSSFDGTVRIWDATDDWKCSLSSPTPVRP